MFPGTGILDALLNPDGWVKPEMVATDNASYSDMVFDLFKILGCNFSPRFRPDGVMGSDCGGSDAGALIARYSRRRRGARFP
ncbi:Tn3 family transposase [Streptomyces sp. NPDC051051]|uniref:Tn3 family transposase n=1 Tax=Streptomyces sp. NPDC051051 TaxID=3155666 RepID=UPI003449394B